ncbi:hypothetical protein ACVGVM_14025 [Pseudonocardia bannensis]|uniref:HEPN domain-containing protein n=1 Tax=Pseudonocardia bannensis TaxID=630973 RepID=A0A848DKR5_9PSEU|nr:hypothetical protein [Pseudonocardia bannensis]NMH93330.1 hypothetical protein [Pseudonocardia bannensis]
MSGDVDRLLAAARLERVPPDAVAAHRAIRAARRHLESAEALAEEDPDLAYTALYDAMRKACAALLQGRGLRATSRGGHLAVQNAVTALYGRTGVLRPFDRVRRRRNEVEYLGQEVHPDDVLADLPAARRIVEFAARRLDGPAP